MAIVFAMAVPHPPIIIPDIGRGEERKIQNTIDGYMEVARRAAEFNPDTVVVLSPHSTVYSDYFHISPGKSARGDFGRFGARRVSVEMEYDSKFVHELSTLAEIEGFPAGTLGERDPELDHGTLVPLYFLTQLKLRAITGLANLYRGFPRASVGRRFLSRAETCPTSSRRTGLTVLPRTGPNLTGG